MKTLFCLFLMILTTSAQGQIVLDFDTYNVNDNLVEEIYASTSLKSDVEYCMEVLGTYSIWAPAYWTNPCGIIEHSPITPSPSGNRTGNVGFGFRYKFSFPNPSTCIGETFPEIATPSPRIEITLDNGATWFHPDTRAEFREDHEYLYQIIGQGHPLGVRHNSALNSDDYGVLTFTLTEKTTCDAIDNPDSLGVGMLNMPNVFSPNNDGIHDVLLPIDVTGIDKGDILIYSRWGQLLYSDDMTSGWDGKWIGKPCPEGIYYWIVEYTDVNGLPGKEHGFLTLLR